MKEYLILIDKKNQSLEELKSINEKIKDNSSEIEVIKNELLNLKFEKKQKQGDIVNLLSNKESLEEIYKNKLYLLINPNYSQINNINDSGNIDEKNNIKNNNIINISIQNDNKINNGSINYYINNNDNILENDTLNFEENNFKITLNDIKQSDKIKFIEQITNMIDDIFKDDDNNIEIKSKIGNIIENSYELFNKDEVNKNNNEIRTT